MRLLLKDPGGTFLQIQSVIYTVLEFLSVEACVAEWLTPRTPDLEVRMRTSRSGVALIRSCVEISPVALFP